MSNEKTEKKPMRERIQKISYILGVVSKICQYLCIVCAVIVGMGTIVILLCGDMDLLTWRGEVILRSPIQVGFDDFAGLNNEDSVKCMIGVVIKLVFIAKFLEQVELMVKDLKVDETPFQEKNVGRIRKIAIFYLLMSIIDFDTVNGIEQLSMGLSLMGVIGAGIFWLISIIFEYGCELQTEHDETL